MKVPEDNGTFEGLTSHQGGDGSYSCTGVNDEAGWFPVMGESKARGVAAVAYEINAWGRR